MALEVREGYWSDYDLISYLAQTLHHAREHVPPYQGDGEFARDDVDLAFTEAKKWLKAHPKEYDLERL